MLIREAKQDDVKSIVDLSVAAEMFTREESEFLIEMLSAYFAAGDGSDDVWLVSVHEGVVAAVTFHTPAEATNGTWYLKMIGVHPEHQRIGLGRAMMVDVERRLALSDARLLLVETSATPAYAAARAFYSSLGYDEEARVRGYFDDGDDMVLFRKRITELASE